MIEPLSKPLPAPNFLSYPACIHLSGIQHWSPSPRPLLYRAATDLLLPRQLLRFGKVLRCPRDHVMHQTALVPGTMQPATDRFTRRSEKLGKRLFKFWTVTVTSGCIWPRCLASFGVPILACPRAAWSIIRLSIIQPNFFDVWQDV